MDWEGMGVNSEDDYYDLIDWAERTMRYINSMDYCMGTWRGKNIRFKRRFSNHTFTDEECTKLLNDEVIEFTATKEDGSKFTAKGKLENQEYKGRKFVGFKDIHIGS